MKHKIHYQNPCSSYFPACNAGFLYEGNEITSDPSKVTCGNCRRMRVWKEAMKEKDKT